MSLAFLVPPVFTDVDIMQPEIWKCPLTWIEKAPEETSVSFWLEEWKKGLQKLKEVYRNTPFFFLFLFSVVTYASPKPTCGGSSGNRGMAEN